MKIVKVEDHVSTCECDSGKKSVDPRCLLLTMAEANKHSKLIIVRFLDSDIVRPGKYTTYEPLVEHPELVELLEKGYKIIASEIIKYNATLVNEANIHHIFHLYKEEKIANV